MGFITKTSDFFVLKSPFQQAINQQVAQILLFSMAQRY